MEPKVSTQIPLSINDVKFQNVPQNAALLLAKLQQKVARLEITLRDKEAEIAKLNSSCKASYVNELKIQTEVYYQEVFRLKNQLNKLQENPVQCSPSHATERRHNLKKSFETNSSKEEHEDSPPVPDVDKSLLQSIEKLKEENERLTNQLAVIQEDKAKLAAQYESLVNHIKEQEINRVSLSESMTQTSPRIESPPSPKNEISDESLNILKVQIEELQNKEKAWEDERSTYKELVLNLKEDRIFFKDTSQQRNDELWALQKELIKLQREISGLQLNGKPICKQCTKPSYRTTKLTRKIVVKDIGTVTTPRSSSKGSGSASATSSCDKNSSKTKATVASGSPKRLPTPIKSLKKENLSGSSSSNIVSKSVSSSTPPSSGSDSAQPSPCHKEKTISRSSSVRGSKKDGSSSSPSKCSSIKTKQSSVSPCSSPLKRNSSTHSNSPSVSCKGSPPIGNTYSNSPSGSPKGTLPIGSNVSPSKNSSHSPSVGSNVSPNKSSIHSPPTASNISPKTKSSSHSPLDSPLRGKPQQEHQEKEHQNSRSHSTDSSSNTSPRSKLVKKLEKIKEDEDDEIIAIEILKELDSEHIEDSSSTHTNEDRRNSRSNSRKNSKPNSLLSSSKPSQSVEEDTDVRVPSIEDAFVLENKDDDNHNMEEDSVDQEPVEEPYYEKVSEKSLKALFCLLEGHENRKKKVQELKTNLTKSGSLKTESPKSVSNSRRKYSLPKSKSSSTESRQLSSPSTARSSTASVAKGSPAKSSPKKLKRVESRSEREFKNPPGEEGENMKDIDRMIGLLEGHIARKAFLALYSHNSGLEDSQEVT